MLNICLPMRQVSRTHLTIWKRADRLSGEARQILVVFTANVPRSSSNSGKVRPFRRRPNAKLAGIDPPVLRLTHRDLTPNNTRRGDISDNYHCTAIISAPRMSFNATTTAKTGDKAYSERAKREPFVVAASRPLTDRNFDSRIRR
jgi:hypothetical protein